jgi:hypothetical protein
MNAHSKIEPNPLDGFPSYIDRPDASNIADFNDLNIALTKTCLNVRALAWMQHLIADAFAEPDSTLDAREPFSNDRVDLFMGASNIITRAIADEVHYLRDFDMSRLVEAIASKRGRR